MKTILLSCLLFLSLIHLSAQDIKTVKKYLDATQLDKAKTEIDNYLAKNPNNAEGLYYKSKVYGSIAANDQFKSLAPDGRQVAFDAFKQAVDVDKDNKLMILMVQDKYKPIFDLYAGYYDKGIKDFNAAVTNKDKAYYDSSMNNFLKANEVGNYIYSKQWALSSIDTQLVLNIGKAALNAGNKEQALTYFKKLADSNIVRTKDDSSGYELPYQWLALYYKDAKDEANLMKYADLGRKNFPNSDYFDAIMLDYYRSTKNRDALFKKYQEVVTRFPDSAQYHFNYANEAFNYVYNSDAGTKIENREELLKTVGTELEAALRANPDDVNTNWLYGQYYYNAGVDLREKANAIKGTKPEDVKAKADLNSQAKAMYAKAVPFGEKALASLETGNKKTERSRYKSVVDLMQRIHQGLDQNDKVKTYQQMYDAADTKFVN
jgi:hypothetical protein